MSLHKAPNTSEKFHPLNAHWTFSHVDYLLDSTAEDSNAFFLDSKDAKCTISGNIQLVLKPGQTWRNFETPDHMFDQSRVNPVTPMSHLFMEIRKQPELDNANLLIPHADVTINVTRTIKGVTLINLSLTEPERVFRVFNQLLFSSHMYPKLRQVLPQSGNRETEGNNGFHCRQWSIKSTEQFASPDAACSAALFP